MKASIFVTAAAALLALPGVVFADEGKDLARKNACLSCHSVDRHIVGPAYKEVAKKYANDKAAHGRLVAKVKAGGSGVWGDVPMPPNPQVKPEDLDKIIDWVLSQK